MMRTNLQTDGTTAPTHWFVRSSNNPNAMYEVAVDRGFLRCSCPAAIYRPAKRNCHLTFSIENHAVTPAEYAAIRILVDQRVAIMGSHGWDRSWQEILSREADPIPVLVYEHY